MDVAYTFRNMKSSKGLKSFAASKLERIEKFAGRGLRAEWVFDTARRQHSAELSVSIDGRSFIASDMGDDLRAAIDSAVNKLDRQIRAQRSLRRSRKRQAAPVAEATLRAS